MADFNLGNAFTSGAQGALAGSTFGPVGTAIGGGIGLLSGLFSSDPADLAKQWWETFKKSLQDMKANTLATGTSFINSQTAANKADATIRGKRNAIASGRDYQSQSFILPGTGQAETTGANALDKFTLDTNQQFNNAEIQANLGEMNLPLPTQPSEYFDVAANAVGQYGANKKKYKMLEDAMTFNQGMDTREQNMREEWMRRMYPSNSGSSTPEYGND